MLSDVETRTFSKEQLQSRAREFMRMRFGNVPEMASIADRRYHHEALGVLMAYIQHIWGEFGGG